jgi:hypothetical protein
MRKGSNPKTYPTLFFFLSPIFLHGLLSHFPKFHARVAPLLSTHLRICSRQAKQIHQNRLVAHFSILLHRLIHLQFDTSQHRYFVISQNRRKSTEARQTSILMYTLLWFHARTNQLRFYPIHASIVLQLLLTFTLSYCHCPM